MSHNPIEQKEQRVKELDNERISKTQELIKIVRDVEENKQRALKSIEEMKLAVEYSTNEFFKYINELNIIKVKLEK